MRSPLLLENGAREAGADGQRLGKGALVLSRALCRFRFFSAPSGLRRAQVDKAARLFAEAHSPFKDTGTLILRSKLGAAIWYWDKQKLGGQNEVSPESVWRSPGEGWRVVRCVEGFEAEAWAGSVLIASTWRRGPFSAAQWSAFTLSVEGWETPPPSAPPDPVSVAAGNGAWRRARLRAPLTWRHVQDAAATVGLCLVGLAAFFAGQAASHAVAARQEERAGAAFERLLRDDPGIARANEWSAVVAAYARQQSREDPLLSAAQGLEVLRTFGLEVRTWRADRRGFRAMIDAPGRDLAIREVIAALNATPLLCEATPELAGGGQIELRAGIVSSDGVCGAAAGEGQP